MIWIWLMELLMMTLEFIVGRCSGFPKDVCGSGRQRWLLLCLGCIPWALCASELILFFILC
jgi:hypothetical protein